MFEKRHKNITSGRQTLHAQCPPHHADSTLKCCHFWLSNKRTVREQWINGCYTVLKDPKHETTWHWKQLVPYQRRLDATFSQRRQHSPCKPIRFIHTYNHTSLRVRLTDLLRPFVVIARCTLAIYSVPIHSTVAFNSAQRLVMHGIKKCNIPSHK